MIGRRRLAGLGLLVLSPAAAVLTGLASHRSVASAEVRVSLAGSVPEWAVPAQREAPVPDSELVDLAVYMSWRNPEEAVRLAEAVSDPRSPRYGRHLGAAEFRERFAPAAADVEAVAAWLRSQELRVVDIPANRHFVAAEGTAAQVAAAFGTGLAGYRVGDRVLRGPTVAPSMPALHGVVAVSGLDEGGALVRPDHAIAGAATPSGFVNAPPCSAWWGERLATELPPAYGTVPPYVPCGYSAAQLRAVYGLTHAGRDGLDGRGQTVAVTDAYASPTIRADVDRYSQSRGLVPFGRDQLTEIRARPLTSPQAGTHCDPGGWYAEESLDVEAVHLLAPRARVVYAGARDCSNTALDEAITTVLDGELALVITNSWGSPGETAGRAQLQAFADTFLQAAIEGIAVIFASGDNGDQVARRGERAVDFPSSAPWVTSAGGTSLGIGADGERIFETGWGVDRTTLAGGAWPSPPGTFLYGSGGAPAGCSSSPATSRARSPTRCRATPAAPGRGPSPTSPWSATPTPGSSSGSARPSPTGCAMASTGSAAPAWPRLWWPRWCCSPTSTRGCTTGFSTPPSTGSAAPRRSATWSPRSRPWPRCGSTTPTGSTPPVAWCTRSAPSRRPTRCTPRAGTTT